MKLKSVIQPTLVFSDGFIFTHCDLSNETFGSIQSEEWADETLLKSLSAILPPFVQSGQREISPSSQRHVYERSH